MLDHPTRSAILVLRQQGHGYRTIARALKVSRSTVKKVLASGSPDVPPLVRHEKGAEHLDRIRELIVTCKGNLVRVHEELAASGAQLSYQALTAFCRKHGLGKPPKQRAGRYHFEPGEEMQHDTSPHDVLIGDRMRRVQCASLVLCHSRMRFAQCYYSFDRFAAKLFLTDALVFFGGAAQRCMVDNTSVVIAYGSGATAVPAPEMQAFGERFGFVFAAHEIGDANRSARVERPFHDIEHNFYAGRTFADLADLNRQLADWCTRYNGSFRRHLHARPVELFAAERPQLVPLPIYVPEVYDVHYRIVDVEGYVTVHTNRYSVDDDLIGRRVQVHETKDRIRVYHGGRLSIEHERQEPKTRARITLPQHRHQGRMKRGVSTAPLPEEQALRTAGGPLAELLDHLKRHHRGRAVRQVRQLYRMYLDYPTQPLLDAVTTAVSYGLTDLARIERMVLEAISKDFFKLPALPMEDHDE